MLPKLPAFTLPAPVAAIVSRLPMWPLEQLLTRALDLGVGRVVSRDAVAPLVGRRFSLCVRDLGVTVRFEGTWDGFRPASPPYAPDLSITATLRDYIALGLREEDPDTLFFARRLSIEGDTDLGLTVKNLLDGIDWGAALRALAESLPQPLRQLVSSR
jgi:predicted lipid carrier protein YhbT